ncbi:hypothetical protein WS81_02330 [Burkholderia sp. MSMB2040]|nr:hypothetical protein WS78_32230 [Burkholderia savannae]KVG38948.1 hypothetical protein WS77_20585 [Burkholderia sp. MSMB0265]KVG81673.1 hypothetical protein WS81_02330 [Burkholderia sp. MSMB2040]KVG99011.1 hypothetical protein WS82_25780 [Burkholderia sp. MSMB2041]KVK76080.1 hypothetical protein WS91_16825 [Burkholderia sp. MSMB1498]
MREHQRIQWLDEVVVIYKSQVTNVLTRHGDELFIVGLRLFMLKTTQLFTSSFGQFIQGMRCPRVAQRDIRTCSQQFSGKIVEHARLG